MRKLAVVSMLSFAFFGCGGSSNDQISLDEALVGVWALSTYNGVTLRSEAGVEFKSNGAFASNGWDNLGMCDSSGTWVTSDGVLTLTHSAFSSTGTNCVESGSKEEYRYTVGGVTLTGILKDDGTVMVFTKM